MASHARVVAVGETNVGMKRTHNEDNFAVIDDDHLYVVADVVDLPTRALIASRSS